MSTKLGLGARQIQTTKLSPLQITTIKLIEMPTLDLLRRIDDEIMENPALEEDESKERDEDPQEVSLDTIKDDDPIPSYNLKLQRSSDSTDDRTPFATLSERENFYKSLKEQLGFRNLSEQQYAVGTFIIGSIDGDGYLRRDISTVVDDMAFRAGIMTTDEEALEVLKVIQSFEPSGVGARDLRECLLIQLKALNDSESVRLATKIVDLYFEELSSKHYNKIISRLSITEEQMKKALARITKLNPKPGGLGDGTYIDMTQQIIPDFVLDIVDGDPVLSMPRYNVPELKVSRQFQKMLEDPNLKTDKDSVTFARQKIDAAKWFIEAIKQRHNTLESTMKAILDYQKEYFMDGDEARLKPMVLKDIAEKTGFDISTISRVVNSKYIQTYFGIFSLKSFFSEGLENQDGTEVSTREIKKVLQELVDNENKRKPLTDDELVEALTDKGYKVARRTIAKYRDQLNIPKARLRKEL
jgi:RNA polymerase sigma-54 factor